MSAKLAVYFSELNTDFTKIFMVLFNVIFFTSFADKLYFSTVFHHKKIFLVLYNILNLKE